MDDLVPMEGYVLVELASEYAQIETPDKPYATRTSGVVVKVPSKVEDAVNERLLGKTVYFEEYKDGIKAGDNLAFIKKEFIAGFVGSDEDISYMLRNRKVKS